MYLIFFIILCEILQIRYQDIRSKTHLLYILLCRSVNSFYPATFFVTRWKFWWRVIFNNFPNRHSVRWERHLFLKNSRGCFQTVELLRYNRYSSLNESKSSFLAVLLLLREASAGSPPYRRSHFLPQTYQDKYTLSTLPRTPLVVHPSENISNEQTIRFEPALHHLDTSPPRLSFFSPREEVAAFDNQSQFHVTIYLLRGFHRDFSRSLSIPRSLEHCCNISTWYNKRLRFQSRLIQITRRVLTDSVESWSKNLNGCYSLVSYSVNVERGLKVEPRS